VIVILNWNGRDYIRGCVRSALDQTYGNFRVLVVDNGSTDGSRETVADEFPEAGLLPLPDNLHFARGSNAGFEEALRDPECAFVAPLNNDTRVDPEWLASLVASAQEPRVGTVASKMVFMDRPEILNSTGIAIARDGSGLDRGWNQRDEGQFDTAVDVFGPSAGAALYRREVLETVGLFDADFVAYYEDLDLAWRARLAGWEGRFSPRAVVFHKYSASTSPRALWKTYQGERNRIWNLVQNYPRRLIATAVPWNAGRLGAALLRRSRSPRPASGLQGPSMSEVGAAMARARLDAYRGLPRAIRKRRLRAAYRKVGAGIVAAWLRQYGVGWRDLPVD